MNMKIQYNRTKEVPNWLLFYDFYHKSRIEAIN